MSQLLTDLKALGTLLNNPSNWTKGTMARTINHQAVTASDKNAVCWCLTGAARKVASSDIGKNYYDRVTNMAHALRPGGRVVTYNDSEHTSHSMILATIDNAIRREEAHVATTH